MVNSVQARHDRDKINGTRPEAEALRVRDGICRSTSTSGSETQTTSQERG